MYKTSYEINKKGILKYQKENPNYRIYKRKYETYYREENRIKINYTSWKCMHKKIGLRVTPQKEMNYLLKRFLYEQKKKKQIT